MNQELSSKVKELFEESHLVMGYQTMTFNINLQLLAQSKNTINHKRIRRIMRILKLKSITRHARRGYIKTPEGIVTDNILNRNFYSQKINEKWVTDFSCLKYNHGKNRVWLSSILDLCSHENIAWKICTGPTVRNAIATFKMAFDRFSDAQPIVHSDRGASYISFRFHDFLTDHNCTQSMSNPGTPYDNAVMESWWNLFKTDWFYLEANELTDLKDIEHLIENGIHYFNTKRRTSKRGGLTPEEIRNQIA